MLFFCDLLDFFAKARKQGYRANTYTCVWAKILKKCGMHSQ